MTDDFGTEGRVEMTGPFETWRIAIGGRRAEMLTAHPLPDGSVNLSLDGRFVLLVPREMFPQVALFAANCVAVGMGYACMPSGDDEAKRRPHFPKMLRIGSVETEDARPLKLVPDGEADRG